MTEETLIIEKPAHADSVAKPREEDPAENSPWSPGQKNLFRFVFLYFLIQCLPINAEYFRNIFSADWTRLYYGDLFNLSRFYPTFFPGYTIWDWVVVAVVAGIGTVVWGRVAKPGTDYEKLYYYLRVLVRYRLALAVLAYGFIKVFPLQAPYPTLGNLNTRYGDFTTWKMFSLSLGAAPMYEIFLGLVEVTAGLLLLGRRTATLGAVLLLAYVGNVFLVNLAYEGGEYLYSLYLVSFALFLLAYDANRIVQLVCFHKPTYPSRFNPVFAQGLGITRIALKGLFVFVFVFLLGIRTYSGFKENPHNIPVTPGLSGASGLYNVTEFTVNGKQLPYSPTDPVRWRDVVFEEWATVSVRSNVAAPIMELNAEVIPKSDLEKFYESAGTSGRHYYQYEADTLQKVLHWKAKNGSGGDEYTFRYQRSGEDELVLDGKNSAGEQLHIVLHRVNKQYLFPLGRSKPLKL